jgi:Na+/melibiose symporter-like transporter
MEAVCKTVLTGKVGEYKGFTATYTHVDKSAETDKSSGASKYPTWMIRAVVAVVVIVLLIVTLWILHGCYEKYSNVSDDINGQSSIASNSTFQIAEDQRQSLPPLQRSERTQ